MKFSLPIFSFLFVVTCGSNAYNPTCLLSCCSLIPPLCPLNCQFFLVPYFLPRSNPFFPLLSPFSLIASFASSWNDCSKSQPIFIFPRHLHSCYVSCLSFFLNLHYYYTCFHYSYLDNDYNNNKYFSILILMATRKMHI